MQGFRVAWRGQDLFDSIEEEGMTLGARACYRIACELVSSIRCAINGYVPEPRQDDSWASLEFSNLGERVRCVVAMQDENDYSIDVSCVQSLLRTLFGKKPPDVRAENFAIVKNALAKNVRFEILAEERVV